jgi:hypothetical protein
MERETGAESWRAIAWTTTVFFIYEIFLKLGVDF